MKCRVCKEADFVYINKSQSNKDKRLDKQISICVCKKCDPVLASFALIENGYEEAIKKLQPITENKNENV